MSVKWTGAFANVATAGQRITGWSENTTAAGTLKNVAGTGRYLDGNCMSAFLGMEIAGNVNYHVATSRRVIWQQAFMSTGTADTDGPRANTGTSWADMAAWYAIQPRVILIPSPKRGESPPRLSVRVAARKSAAVGGDCTVRVYSFASKQQALTGFPVSAPNAPAESRASFAITTNTFPATPGWSTAATIDIPQVQTVAIAYPNAENLPDTEVWITYLVLAAVGNGAQSCIVQAVQVIEELRGS